MLFLSSWTNHSIYQSFRLKLLVFIIQGKVRFFNGFCFKTIQNFATYLFKNTYAEILQNCFPTVLLNKQKAESIDSAFDFITVIVA